MIAVKLIRLDLSCNFAHDVVNTHDYDLARQHVKAMFTSLTPFLCRPVSIATANLYLQLLLAGL